MPCVVNHTISCLNHKRLQRPTKGRRLCCKVVIRANRDAVEKKTVLENLDLVLLAMDEIIDSG